MQIRLMLQEKRPKDVIYNLRSVTKDEVFWEDVLDQYLFRNRDLEDLELKTSFFYYEIDLKGEAMIGEGKDDEDNSESGSSEVESVDDVVLLTHKR